MHVASALHYLSREDVVHLDVKPDNLVMGAPPRLIDFSVSRGLAAAARLTKPVGTDEYMAPEQCDRSRGDARARRRRVRARCDDVPRDDRASGRSRAPRARPARRTRRCASRSSRARPAPLPRRTPAPLAELLRAMLAPQPGDRPTAAQVVAALEPVVAELPRRLVLGRRGWRARH